MADQLYLSPVVGDGTPTTNPYRPHLFDITPTPQAAQVIELPSNPDGSPKKTWVLVIVTDTDFTRFDGDAQLLSIASMGGLDATITNQQRNRFNNYASAHGITTRATTGETFRALINAVLAELGSTVRL